MLQKITGMIGFIMLMIGAGGMDSYSIAVPAAMAMAGMGMLYWSAWESGIFNEQKIDVSTDQSNNVYS
jgi:hypothetical protein